MVYYLPTAASALTARLSVDLPWHHSIVIRLVRNLIRLDFGIVLLDYVSANLSHQVLLDAIIGRL